MIIEVYGQLKFQYKLTYRVWTVHFSKSLIVKGTIYKVEFIQPSNWLYSVPNLFVIQHLVTLYLGGFDVRVVSELE